MQRRRVRTKLTRKGMDNVTPSRIKRTVNADISSKILELNTGKLDEQRVHTRTSSVNCMGRIKRPPISCRPRIERTALVNNFKFEGIREEDVTEAVYMFSTTRMPVKKPFRPYRHLKEGSDSRLIESTYLKNTRFLVRALGIRDTNVRLIVKQAELLERWYIDVKGLDPELIVGPNCPEQLRAILSPKA